MKNIFNNKTILITGGTGSFGQAFTKHILKKYNCKKIIIFSRDENKQYHMQKKFPQKNIRYFIGDVRDKERLVMAMRGVDYVVHAAAQKHVPLAEYNPIECVKTNIDGSQNIIISAIECKVKRVIALSTDKATNPVNLYGATKLAAEKLFLSAHSYVGSQNTKFGVVRYGNVINSRGSVIPLFKDHLRKKNSQIPITHPEMTRFFQTLEQSVEFVIRSLSMITNSELFIPKMYSLKILDLLKSLDQKAKYKIIGIRQGEKIHEVLFSTEESRFILEIKDFYVIFQNLTHLKSFKSSIKSKIKSKIKKMENNFYYTSKTNKDFLNLNKINKVFDLS